MAGTTLGSIRLVKACEMSRRVFSETSWPTTSPSEGRTPK